MKRNLVIVPAGDTSLHESYASPDRGFDLWVLFFGDDDSAFARYAASADRIWRLKGYQLDLLRQAVLGDVLFKEPGRLASYDYVMFPDEDIEVAGGAPALDAFFDALKAVGADAGQPALVNEFASHPPTRQVPGAYCHSVNWIEIMMPAYSGHLFQNAFLPAVHTFDQLRTGWAIDVIAHRLAEAVLGRPVRAFVMDACGVVHTRSVGTNKALFSLGYTEFILVPQVRWLPRMETLAVYGSAEEAAAGGGEFSVRSFDRATVNRGMQRYLQALQNPGQPGSRHRGGDSGSS